MAILKLFDADGTKQDGTVDTRGAPEPQALRFGKALYVRAADARYVRTTDEAAAALPRLAIKPADVLDCLRSNDVKVTFIETPNAWG